MNRTVTAVLAGAGILFGGLVGTACGDDDSSSGDPQGQVADMSIEALEEEGIAVDEDCVREAADKLSDEDAQAIADAGLEGDPEVSAEAEAVGESLISCVDLGDTLGDLDLEGIDLEDIDLDDINLDDLPQDGE